MKGKFTTDTFDLWMLLTWSAPVVWNGDNASDDDDTKDDDDDNIYDSVGNYMNLVMMIRSADVFNV